MSDFSFRIKTTDNGLIKTGDRGVTFNHSLNETQKQGEIKDLKTALENAQKPAPYDSSLQLTFPVAGEKNKFVTGRIDLRDRGGIELANKIMSMLENQQHFCYDPKNSKLLELNNSNSPQAKTLNLFSESNEAKEKYEKQIDKNFGTSFSSGVKGGNNPRESTAISQTLMFTSEEVKKTRNELKSALNQLENSEKFAEKKNKLFVLDNTKVTNQNNSLFPPEKKVNVEIAGVNLKLNRQQLGLLANDPQAIAGLISLKQIFDQSPAQAKMLAAMSGDTKAIRENEALTNLTIASGIQGGEKAGVAAAKIISKQAGEVAHKLLPKVAGPVDLFFISKHMSHSLPEAWQGDPNARAAFGLQFAEAVTTTAILAGKVSGGVGTVAVLSLAAAAELCLEIAEEGKKVTALNQAQKAEIARQFAESLLKEKN